MKSHILMFGAVASLGLAGCVAADGGVDAADDVPRQAIASAQLLNAAGQSMGTATATQSGDSIRVRIEGAGLPQGAHGAHIHMTGQCVAPGFESAGGHWNPTGRAHGSENPAGMHKGDMPNILIGTNGAGTLEYTIAGARVSGGSDAMLDQDGAAIVIHAGPDDYRSDPSGNSGARIACGVFSPA